MSLISGNPARRLCLARIVSIIVACLAFASSAPAAMLTLNLSFEYSGAADPAGPQPWGIATFDDGGAMGTVKLTLEALNLSSGEFLTNWLFNLDPALDPNQLVFAGPVPTGAFGDPTISTGADAFNAGPAHGFDIQFGFPTKGGGGGASRFGAGESAVYTITGIATLTANSFNFPNSSGAGPFFTAAHVQGITDTGNGSSGWVSVPEPSTGLLAIVGISGWTLFSSWRRRRT